ncbi:MAG TPA: YhbY family RNA-binding protein [Methanomicrobia archaeon]|nr:YhbY family RNA-binding protein [Methanomicrobia archaeon]
MVDKTTRKEIITSLGPETPSVIIGRNGLTQAVVDEIASQLKKKGTIKISLHPSIEHRDSFVETLCKSTDAELVDLRGRKAILYRKR